MDKFRTVFSWSLNNKDDERRSHQFMKRHSNPAPQQSNKVPEWRSTLNEPSPLTTTSDHPWIKKPDFNGLYVAANQGSLTPAQPQQGQLGKHELVKALSCQLEDLSFRQENNNKPLLAGDTGTIPNDWRGQAPLIGRDTIGTTLQYSRYQQIQQEQSLANAHHPPSFVGAPHFTPIIVSPAQPASLMPAASTTSSRLEPSWTPPPYNNVSTNISPVPHTHFTNQHDWAHPPPSSLHHHQQKQQDHAVTANSNGSKNTYTHSRSRSLPSASYGTALLTDMTPTRPTMASSRSSMDSGTFHRLLLDPSKSLLLTQKYIPPTHTNPFEDDNSHDSDFLLDQTNTQNPFEDHTNDDSRTTKGVTPTMIDLGIVSARVRNQQPNDDTLPAPPVPPQSTKPAFPRYGRHRPLKRSSSQHVTKSNPFISQGTFLLATSSASSPVQFPLPFAVDSARLFRHKSAHSLPHTE